MTDILIRNVTIIDGTGAPQVAGDIAIDAGRITQVGGKAGAAQRVIDASGAIVTPGWVDVHTHYDGQVTWDPYITPSSWHGVTTAVMGNCGVGFAPVKPDRHDWLIGLMEGVEDIPGSALAEGIQWEWETFAQYMDALARKPLAVDVGTQVPHGALRVYAMGDRGVDEHSVATADDIRAFRRSHPGVVVLAHPECPREVVEAADFAGSTADMIRFVERERPKRVALITECSMSDNVAVNFPEVEFVRPCNLCPHMKRITLGKIRRSLETLTHEVTIDAAVAERGRLAVARMLDVR